MAGRRRAAALVCALAIGALACATGLAAWLSPGARELALLAGLASGVHPLQLASAEALADSPSNRAALGLVAFVNLKYRPEIDSYDWDDRLREPAEAPDARLAEIVAWLERFECLPRETGVPGLRALSDVERVAVRSCAEEAVRRYGAERERDAELAEQGLLSLCRLSGHAFGTWYEETDWGYGWGSLDGERWATALSELNGWAFETFGRELVAQLAGPALEAMASAGAFQEPAQ